MTREVEYERAVPDGTVVLRGARAITMNGDEVIEDIVTNLRPLAGFNREDSVRDIGALLDWIETEPTLDQDRVAVFGGSYGGYMVLASSFHYSDRLKAAVGIVGISNFVTFLENTQDYRRALRRAEYGDERDPEMRAFFEQISPVNNVEKISTDVTFIEA